MSDAPTCPVCGKPILSKAASALVAGEVVHLFCLARAEKAQRLRERVQARSRRAAKFAVGGVERVDAARGELVVGGLRFTVAEAVALEGIRRGQVVQVQYEEDPSGRRAVAVRRLGAPPPRTS
jgi:hypothetical protein